MGIGIISLLSKYKSVKMFFGIWTLLLLFTPIINFSFGFVEIGENENKVTYQKNFKNIVLKDKPDIYFVLYDGLASLDTLDKYYNYKADPLKKFLANNDFYIAKKLLQVMELQIYL